MRWPKRAASNGYDLGRDAPFGIVRLPAHSSRLANVKRRPQAAPLFFSAAARGALRRLRQGGQIGLGGRKRALAVGPDRVEPFCPLKQHDDGLPFFPHSLASRMAACIASNGAEKDCSWSLNLTAQFPLRLSTMNCVSAT